MPGLKKKKKILQLLFVSNQCSLTDVVWLVILCIFKNLQVSSFQIGLELLKTVKSNELKLYIAFHLQKYKWVCLWDGVCWFCRFKYVELLNYSLRHTLESACMKKVTLSAKDIY